MPFDANPTLGASHAVGCRCPGIKRRGFDGKRRLHDEMEAAVRFYQEGKVLRAVFLARSGYFEDAMSILEKSIHRKHLSA